MTCTLCKTQVNSLMNYENIKNNDKICGCSGQRSCGFHLL